MTRLTLTLATWVILVPAALASLTPRGDRSVDERKLLQPLAARPRGETVTPVPAHQQGNDYTLTDKTEVLLDGKPCRFAEVPEHAVIVGMEVAADRKTVLKVRFRSGK